MRRNKRNEIAFELSFGEKFGIQTLDKNNEIHVNLIISAKNWVLQ